jgi:preprotein translocase subunit SecE
MIRVQFAVRWDPTLTKFATRNTVQLSPLSALVSTERRTQQIYEIHEQLQNVIWCRRPEIRRQTVVIAGTLKVIGR